MPTDKQNLQITVEKVNEAYTPAYIPLFPVITKTKKYDEVIGEVKMHESTVIGDARARVLNAQDTEWKHAKSGTKSKVFNKFFSGIKHIVSGFVDNSDFQKTADEILDINLMEFDKKVFLGEGNNGLWVSNDPDYITNSSATLASSPTVDAWKSLFDDLLEQSEKTLGNVEKTIVVVGVAANKLGKFMPNLATTYARAIMDAYKDAGKQVEITTAPANLTADISSASGVLVLTPSKILHRYTVLPSIKGRGYNEENAYTWMSLVYGSSMIDVEKKGAIIKQPITFGS